MVYSKARLFTRDPDTAADMVQNVFEKLIRFLPPNIECPATFLAVMVKHECFTHMRDEKTMQRHCNACAAETAQSDCPMYEQWNLDHLQAMVKNALGKVTPRERQIFEMSRVDNFTIDEIAATLKLTARTVKNSLSITIHKLRKHLPHDKI